MGKYSGSLKLVLCDFAYKNKIVQKNSQKNKNEFIKYPNEMQYTCSRRKRASCGCSNILPCF